MLSQGLSRSLHRELNSFYKQVLETDYSIAAVTKGALTHARRKLKPEAFKELNTEALRTFYEEAPWLKWRGHRLLSIDGSTLVLPKHKTITEEFGSHGFGSKADSINSMATVSMLYDVLNLTTLDCQVGGYETSERSLLDLHLDQATFLADDLVSVDRGYAGIGLMYEFVQRGIAFCMRIPENWWTEARHMIAEGQTDKVVTFTLSKKDQYLLEKYHSTNKHVRCRMVIIELEGGGKEVLCTSLMDQQKYPLECLKELYKYRWNIEESYKLFKCRASLEVFSGKTAQAVKQDIFAKVFMMSMAAILSFPIAEKVKKEYHKASHRKRQQQINRTDALAIVKETWVGMFIRKAIRKALKAIDSIVQKSRDIIRPNRKFKRKNRTKRPPYMNYKQL